MKSINIPRVSHQTGRDWQDVVALHHTLTSSVPHFATMPYVDHTAEFRNLAREKSKEYGSKGKAKAFARPDNNTLDPLSKEYLAEAYNVVSNVSHMYIHLCSTNTLRENSLIISRI